MLLQRFHNLSRFT